MQAQVTVPVKMYFANRRNLDTWSTDNCCIRWSLRNGTIFIASASLIWFGLSAVLFGWMTYECWGVGLANCSLVPEPEKKMISVTTNEDDTFDIDVVLCILAIYFGIYSFMSLLVVIGTIKSIPKLLQGWIYCTFFTMALVFVDLVITLVFTTIFHLIFCVSAFVISLYTWAVVRSHMKAVKLAQSALPLPDNAVKEYTVDGLDLDALAIESKI